MTWKIKRVKGGDVFAIACRYKTLNANGKTAYRTHERPVPCLDLDDNELIERIVRESEKRVQDFFDTNDMSAGSSKD